MFAFFQSMKDYAEQQRRLHQDINNHLERNRDIIRKIDERRKIEETLLKEEAMKNTMTVMNGNDVKLDDVPYIPSLDKIKRPKLLFMQEKSREQSLDSPECLPDLVASPPVTSPLATASSLTPPLPSGDLLLSPQYCEKMKAKKLFSITKVDESALSGISVSSPVNVPVSLQQMLPCDQSALSLDNQLPVLNSSLMSSDIVTPTSLCHTLVSETVDNYIQQIVCDNALNTEGNERRLTNGEDSISSLILKGQLTNKTVNSDLEKTTTDILQAPMDSSSENGIIGSSKSNSDVVPQHEKLNDYKQNVTRTESSLCHESQKPESISVGSLGDTNLNGRNAMGDGSQSAIDNGKDNSSAGTALNGDGSKMLSPEFVVDSSDTLMRVDTAGQTRPVPHDAGKPDFYTNLTMNGMTQELATVLDSLDKEYCDNGLDNKRGE